MLRSFVFRDCFWSRLVLTAFSLFLLLFFSVDHAKALSAGGISAFPANPDQGDIRTKSWFIYNLNPGESKEDAVTIRNDSDREQSLRLYAVDAVINNVGGFALGQESDERFDVGRWVELPESSVVLRPGELKSVKFKIKVPADAGVGEHAGGIVIQKGLTEEQKGVQGGFVITTRLGVRIYQTVPGEINKKASFGQAVFAFNDSVGRYILNVPVNNDGNVSLEAKVELAAHDQFFNRQNHSIQVPLSIPRGSKMNAKLELPAPKVGRFEATLKMTYLNRDGQEETVIYPETFHFWAIPWQELALAGLIILANLIFLAFNWWSKRRESRYYKEYQVYEGEDLPSIAESLGISWKKLAKINHLKAPYTIHSGQTIIVYDKNGILEYEEEEFEEKKKELNASRTRKEADIKEAIEEEIDFEDSWQEEDEDDEEEEIVLDMPVRDRKRKTAVKWKKSPATSAKKSSAANSVGRKKKK